MPLEGGPVLGGMGGYHGVGCAFMFGGRVGYHGGGGFVVHNCAKPKSGGAVHLTCIVVFVPVGGIQSLSGYISELYTNFKAMYNMLPYFIHCYVIVLDT